MREKNGAVHMARPITHLALVFFLFRPGIVAAVPTVRSRGFIRPVQARAGGRTACSNRRTAAALVRSGRAAGSDSRCGVGARTRIGARSRAARTYRRTAAALAGGRAAD